MPLNPQAISSVFQEQNITNLTFSQLNSTFAPQFKAIIDSPLQVGETPSLEHQKITAICSFYFEKYINNLRNNFSNLNNYLATNILVSNLAFTVTCSPPDVAVSGNILPNSLIPGTWIPPFQNASLLSKINLLSCIENAKKPEGETLFIGQKITSEINSSFNRESLINTPELESTKIYQIMGEKIIDYMHKSITKHFVEAFINDFTEKKYQSNFTGAIFSGFTNGGTFINTDAGIVLFEGPLNTFTPLNFNLFKTNLEPIKLQSTLNIGQKIKNSIESNVFNSPSPPNEETGLKTWVYFFKVITEEYTKFFCSEWGKTIFNILSSGAFNVNILSSPIAGTLTIPGTPPVITPYVVTTQQTSFPGILRIS